MIPKETDKEGSETSQGTPSEILSPFLALVQLLRDKQCRPPAHYPGSGAWRMMLWLQNLAWTSRNS